MSGCANMCEPLWGHVAGKPATKMRGLHDVRNFIVFCLCLGGLRSTRTVFFVFDDWAST